MDDDRVIYDDTNPNFYCPITNELLVDPVVDKDGISYERAAIEARLSVNPTSPVTLKPLHVIDLTPNRSLKNAIEAEIRSGKRLKPRLNRAEEKNEEDKDNDRGGANNLDDYPVSLKVLQGPVLDYQVEMLISTFPSEKQVREPADICCVVDVSGSMGTHVSAAGTESARLTILDIVKHAVITIINSLNEDDRLSVVAYSSVATVTFGLLPMSEPGKARAVSLLKGLRADGMTNIWDGLEKGLNVLKEGAETRRHPANASVMLLTDGVPNTDPPKPYEEMLHDYRASFGGKLPGSITTFGFGYQLERWVGGRVDDAIHTFTKI